MSNFLCTQDSSEEPLGESLELKAQRTTSTTTTMLDFFHKQHDDEESNVDDMKKKKKKRNCRPSSKAMTNGVNAGHKSPTSPLSKERIEICEVAKTTESLLEKKRPPLPNGISHFFRPISKTEFIKENENCKSILTVKALVHSPTANTVAAKIEDKEGDDDDGGGGGGGGGKKRSKRKSSKYIRRSEETDVIQVWLFAHASAYIYLLRPFSSSHFQKKL